MLVVRLCGDSVPKSWNRWGRPLTRDSHRLWAFLLPAGMDLANLVHALVTETPAEQLDDCLGVWINPDFDGRLPVSVLDELEPLSVLHARLHEPWIMGELSTMLRPVFQPIVSLQGTGELFGYQMPCVLEHPDRGQIFGREFYQMAQRARRMDAVEQSCQIAALVRRSEYLPRGVPAFVRAFPRSLLQQDLRRHPSYTCLERLGIDPGDIVIEIAERGQVNDIDAVINSCGILRNMGFRIALDEVGGGMGHVGLMASLEPDLVRLDHGLILHAQKSAAASSLLAGLVAIARSIGAKTIADGIEGPESLRLCREIGIDYGQGELIGPCAAVPETPRSLPQTH